MDTLATPIVYGRLKNKKISFTIESSCANSGRSLRFGLTSDLEVTDIEGGAQPMVCVPLVDLATTPHPSILDVF